MSDLDRHTSADGVGSRDARPSDSKDPVGASDEGAVPWPTEDDALARQLRDWRAELTSGGVASPSVPPTTAVPGESVKSEVETSSRTRGSHRMERPEGQQNAEGTSPGTSSWVIPGFGGRLRLTQADLVEDSHGPTTPRQMPSGHRRWDVSKPQSATPDAPPRPQLTPAELATAEARTVGFPALDLVPLGEDEDLELAIEAKGLRKVFKDFVAVDDVSLEVPKGKIVALLGPNGAGKTTTVNMLCTLLKPDAGTATVNGYDVVDDAAGVRKSIMLTGQFAALDEGLTGRENLVMFGRLLGLSKRQAKARAAELLDMFGLNAAASRKVGQYSGGMRRRIDIACGLVTEPTVVFLDEPTTGLDPRSRQDVWALVEQLRSSGVTVLLTTQYLEEADMLSDRIVVIDKGRVIAEGTSDELKAATGAAYCEVTPVHPAYLPRLRGALAGLLGQTAADLDTPDGTIAVPAPDGPATLSEVLRRTEAGNIPLADIALRRPSLDEVFLALTDPTKAPQKPENSHS